MSTKKFCDWCGDEIIKSNEATSILINVRNGDEDKSKTLDLHTVKNEEDQEELTCLKKFDKQLTDFLNKNPSHYR